MTAMRRPPKAPGLALMKHHAQKYLTEANFDAVQKFGEFAHARGAQLDGSCNVMARCPTVRIEYHSGGIDTGAGRGECCCGRMAACGSRN